MRIELTEALHCQSVQHTTYSAFNIAMRQPPAPGPSDACMRPEAACDDDFEPRGNIIDMHMHRLRRKVDGGFAEALIETVAGAGYRLRPCPAD